MNSANEYLLETPLIKFLLLKNTRSYWVDDYFLSRDENGEFARSFEEIRGNDKKFFEYTRMMQSTFHYILKSIEIKLQKHSNFRECISPQEKLVLTLRYLATGASFRSLAFSFRMSHATIRQAVYDTCEAIWVTLFEKHMPFPTESMFLSIAHRFYKKWKFPNCVGAIDGKHIRIKCPANSSSLYFNYKKYFSIVLQGLVDASCKFISIEVGSYGKQSDGGIFKTSALYHHLEQGTLNLPPPRVLPNTDIVVPHVLVGDAAYPLKTYLMRPFSGQVLSPEQEVFNQSLSRARRLVECAFGIMASKWRILKSEIEVHPDKVDLIVKCICLLHNIIIDLEGTPDFIETTQIVQQTQSRARCFNRATLEAYEIRNNFLQYFNRVNTLKS